MRTKHDDRLLTLAATLEECCPPMPGWKMAAFRSGLFEAAGHLMDPGINTLAVAHRQGFNFLCLHFETKLHAQLWPLFNAGFASLLIHADVRLDQLRGKVRGWR